jgi:hypothetical protein
MPAPHQRNYDRVRIEVLDADLTPGEIAAVLEQLKFTHPSTLRAVRIDEGVRDFLLTALRRHTAG